MSLTKALSHTLLLILVALMATGVWFGAQWSLANMSYFEAKNRFDLWPAAGPDTYEEWNKVYQVALAATTRDPRSGEYQEFIGRVLELRASVESSPVSAETKTELRQSALNRYKLATGLRPSWPFGWAQIFRQKALLGQLDGEIDLTLYQINLLGPWQPKLHQVQASIAQYRWEQLSPYARAVLVQTFDRTLTDERYDHSLIRGYGDFIATSICPFMDKDRLTERSLKLCDSTNS